jgi:hypothetical protein
VGLRGRAAASELRGGRAAAHAARMRPGRPPKRTRGRAALRSRARGRSGRALPCARWREPGGGGLCVRAGDWAAGAAAGRGVGMRGADCAGAAPRAAVRPRWRRAWRGAGCATEQSVGPCARWRRAGRGAEGCAAAACACAGGVAADG